MPESAVVDTGTKTIVYVEASPGVFEGRAVVLGPRSGDSFPVRDGLAHGEKVAAAGAFLIDAETRLNPATRAHADVRVVDLSVGSLTRRHGPWLQWGHADDGVED